MGTLEDLENRRDIIRKEIGVLSQLMLHRTILEQELEATEFLIQQTKEREESPIQIPERFKARVSTDPSPPKELSKGVALDVFRILRKAEKPMRAVDIKRDIDSEGKQSTFASVRQALYRNPDYFIEIERRKWGLKI
jgi:hypothetical protein